MASLAIGENVIVVGIAVSVANVKSVASVAILANGAIYSNLSVLAITEQSRLCKEWSKKSRNGLKTVNSDFTKTYSNFTRAQVKVLSKIMP